MTPKQRLHAALAGLSTDRTPITPIFMARAAEFIGRSYRDYYLDHRVLVQSQLAVAGRFHLDQVSSISDPWRESDAFGMQLDYPEGGVGIPRDGRHLLASTADIAQLKPFDPLLATRTRDRIDAISLFHSQVGPTHSILGWVEGPFAQYADLRGVQDACLDLLDEPEAFHRAAGIIIPCAIAFAIAQIRAGADIVGIGDAACSLIGPELYAQHILPWQQKLIAAIHAQLTPDGTPAKVKLHICGNIARILPLLAQTGADIIDIDHMVPLAEARRILGPAITLAGNFDPASILLRGTPAQIRSAADACIRDAAPPTATCFLLQPGCEVPPHTPEANLDAFCPATA
jgi:MtaA/CmuA family methyltransferase